MAEKSNPPFLCFRDGKKKKKLGGGRTSVLGVIVFLQEMHTNDARRWGRGHQPESVPTKAVHHRRVLWEVRLLREHYEESVIVVELLLLHNSTVVVFVVIIADEIVCRRCLRR